MCLPYHAHEMLAHEVDQGAVDWAGPELLMAVALSRPADLVVALLGVLKSGAAFVPADLSYPAVRVGHLTLPSLPLGAAAGGVAAAGASIDCLVHYATVALSSLWWTDDEHRSFRV